MEVGEADPLGGHAVDDRGLDVRAVAAELGEPDVVEHDEYDVGRVLGRGGSGWPPRLRVAPVVADLALELDPAHGPTPMHSTVRRAWHVTTGRWPAEVGQELPSIVAKGQIRIARCLYRQRWFILR